MSATINPNSNSPEALRFEDMGCEGQLKLLDMAHGRLVHDISMKPIMGLAFGYWQYQLGSSPQALLLWSLSYLLAGAALRRQRKQYLQGHLARASRQWLDQQLALVNRIAVIHGLGLAAVGFITVGSVPVHFMLMLGVICASIVAAAASQQAPVLGVFRRFAYAVWIPSMMLTPWSFPDHWLLLLPLSALLLFTFDRQAVVAHGFFLHQIKLEQDSVQLAKDFRLAKEQAEAALQAKNLFLTTASHDLRQPVHAMSFLIESISRRNGDSALQPALQDLKQSVQAITQMFNSLLDLSRIELGALEIQLQAVAADPLLNDVVMLFREEALSRQIELRVRLSGGKAWVKADPILLRRALINLMQNALRYTQRGGVLLTVRRRSGDWQFEVWDTGIGIATDDQQQIFAPFFRPENTWRVDNAGHGLGLAVVARCAELMGASHGLASRLGRGSKFWLQMTAAQAASVPEIGMAANGAAVEQQPLTGRCLIVDDEPQVRSAWQALLSAWGITTVCAASGGEALALLDHGFEPQVIFCDQRLRSGENGFELLQALMLRFPQAVGAMISGEFNSPDLIQAEQEGYLVLHKPLEPEALYVLLNRLLMSAEPELKSA